MFKTKKQTLLLLPIFIIGGLIAKFAYVDAAPNDVIINEIMYHPTSEDEYEEFVELYNTTGSDIDLEGWCLSDGISVCFTAGMSIAAHSYAIVSPDTAQTQSIYGITPLATYGPSTALSNSGETITLLDDSTNVVNSVSYVDDPPWPTTPDGTGPSLELKDVSLDNSDPTNWAASIGSPTPAAENSVMNLNLATITDVSDPNDIDDSETVTITANVEDADTVELEYKVNFDSEVTIAMNDDGSSGDGAAGDGVFGATIPAQAASDLVRFKVIATNGDGESTSPSSDDGRNYYGYVINDPSITTNAELFNWYITDADFATIHATPEVDIYVPAVIAYNGKVYDNAEVRIKGDYSRTLPKKSYKFKLPRGQKINYNGGSNREISEFHMNADAPSEGIARQPVAWWALEQAGFLTTDVAVTRLQRNGAFEGLYVFAEKYEDEWRDEKGYNNGQFIEDWSEVEDGPDDMTNRDSWFAHMMLDKKDSSKRDYVLDENNIPTMLNYMSLIATLHSSDTSLQKNTFLFHSDKTERWEPIFWDLDLVLAYGDPKSYASPYELIYHMNQENEKFALQAIYDQADLRGMYFRRLRTLVDQFYASDALKNKYNEITDLHADEIEQDVLKWPNDPDIGFFRTTVEDDVRNIGRMKYVLTAQLRLPWALPAAQTQQEKESVHIEEAIANANNANEFIKISNSSNAHVDISGWEIEGINYTLPAGSVVPANGSIYLLKDDKAYRAAHASVIVAGQYDTELDGVSDLVLKTDSGQEIDSYAL